MSRAVLLTCHGTVEDLAELGSFLLRIRRGRPVPDDLLREVRHRYEHIGGSPLHKTTASLASKLEAALGVPVAWAARLASPEIPDVLAALAARGVREVLSVPLAPQSVEVYHAAVREAAATTGLDVRACAPYGLAASMTRALCVTIDEALERAPVPAAQVDLVLSAHSLPLRVIRGGDRYEEEFRAMAGACIERIAPRVRSTKVAFQSQGASNEPWLGPDLVTTFRDLRAAGSSHVVIAPIGFVAEHVETLYDLDVEAAALAGELGFESFGRARALDDRAEFLEVLVDVVRGLEPGATDG